MKCVSLFSGAGGLDLGLEAAGFSMAGSVEIDDNCCRTLQANGRNGVLKEDVSAFDFFKLLELGPIDLLAGGPPCQPFSKSALWTHAGTRGLSDPRAATIDFYFCALEALRPKAFVLENVEGFPRLGGLDLLKRQLEGLRAKGLSYSLHSTILNAADFGVPQKRNRFFAIGVRDDGKFNFPAPTHGAARAPYLTAWDACAIGANHLNDEVLDLRGRWADLLPSIPPGKNYLWHTRRGDGVPIFGWRTRYWSFLNKLDPDLPSPTIVANPSQSCGPFHWENRLLSTAELAAIQTFPSSYRFSGERASRQRQIGNAVPPLLAEHVGRSIRLALGHSTAARIVHEIKRVEDRPRVPSSAPVPTSYHKYIGIHPDHPGAGLGPKARRQVTQQLEVLP
jgi:DNA (cytosine-5)-methyltransferase 1